MHAVFVANADSPADAYSGMAVDYLILVVSETGWETPKGAGSRMDAARKKGSYLAMLNP